MGHPRDGSPWCARGHDEVKAFPETNSRRCRWLLVGSRGWVAASRHPPCHTRVQPSRLRGRPGPPKPHNLFGSLPKASWHAGSAAICERAEVEMRRTTLSCALIIGLVGCSAALGVGCGGDDNNNPGGDTPDGSAKDAAHDSNTVDTGKDTSTPEDAGTDT